MNIQTDSYNVIKDIGDKKSSSKSKNVKIISLKIIYIRQQTINKLKVEKK